MTPFEISWTAVGCEQQSPSDWDICSQALKFAILRGLLPKADGGAWDIPTTPQGSALTC